MTKYLGLSGNVPVFSDMGSANLCRAGGKDHGPEVPEDDPQYIWSGPNYLKPCKPVFGKRAEKLIVTCLCCGKTLANDVVQALRDLLASGGWKVSK